MFVAYLFFAHNSDSSTPYLDILQILTLENILSLKLALFMHTIKSDPTNIPVIFSGTFTLASEVLLYGASYKLVFRLSGGPPVIFRLMDISRIDLRMG